MSDIYSEVTSDAEIMASIGRRLAALRKAAGLNQAAAAAQAALDRSTVSRAEQGDNPTLLTIVRLLRVYGRLAALESFIPEPGVSPMQLVREARRRG